MEKVLVIGSGIIGLQTAKTLSDNGINVVLYSSDHPFDTVSNIAGGHWEPFHCEPAELANAWADQTWKHVISQLSGAEKSEYFEKLKYLRPLMQMSFREDELPGWRHSEGVDFKIETLAEFSTSNQVDLSPEVCQYPNSIVSNTVIMNTPKLLEKLVEELTNSTKVSISWNQPRLKNETEMVIACRDNGCKVVVNCTGLGAREIYASEKTKLKPGRGVVVVFKRPEDPLADICYAIRDGPMLVDGERYPIYLIPRNNVLICGGTFLVGDERKDATPEEVETIVTNARKLCPALKGVEPLRVDVGFRPFRESGIRFDSIEIDGVPVVNNFGHGGGGWTLHVGAANANLVAVKSLLSL